MDMLWNQAREVVKPVQLWVAIGKKNDMFQDVAQHDSQEFLAWLLD